MNRSQENELIKESARLDARKAQNGRNGRMETETKMDDVARETATKMEAGEGGISMEWILGSLRFVKYTGKLEVVFREGEILSARRVE